MIVPFLLAPAVLALVGGVEIEPHLARGLWAFAGVCAGMLLLFLGLGGGGLFFAAGEVCLRCGRYRLPRTAFRRLVRINATFRRLRWYLGGPGLFAAAVSAIGSATDLGPVTSAWWLAIPLLLGAGLAGAMPIPPPRPLTWSRLAGPEGT